jgi:dynein heavy chain
VLSESKGNILEDVSAIQILSEAKAVSNDIQEKQVIADETQTEIDAARAGYAPCGACNAVLFFCIRDLAAVDPMYQYSLSWFIKLFVRSIEARFPDAFLLLVW